MTTSTQTLNKSVDNPSLIAPIKERWSPRAFQDKAISSDDLNTILEAGRWAPSCYNDQPWRFIVADKNQHSETWQKIFDCLVEFNQSWNKNTPVLILAVANEVFDSNGKPNRHGQYDTGLAMENMVIQAQSMGIYSHQMAGFDDKKAHDVFNIPEENYTPMAVMALGYPDSPDTLEGDMKERELESRSRKSLDEIVSNTPW